MSTPSDDTVVVNQTTFLPCQASHPEKLDMVYEWTFNDFRLDFRTGHYQLVREMGAVRGGVGWAGLVLGGKHLSVEILFQYVKNTIMFLFVCFVVVWQYHGY